MQVLCMVPSWCQIAHQLDTPSQILTTNRTYVGPCGVDLGLTHIADVADAYPAGTDVSSLDQVEVTLVETANDVRDGVLMLEVVLRP